MDVGYHIDFIYMYVYIYSFHTKPIRERLCTRGTDVQEGKRRQNMYSTVNWSNVTEVTIELIKHSDNEKLTEN